jgi:hypothetical protein
MAKSKKREQENKEEFKVQNAEPSSGPEVSGSSNVSIIPNHPEIKSAQFPVGSTSVCQEIVRKQSHPKFDKFKKGNLKNGN